ncbi:MAG: MFS transporter, partial [Rhizobiaceae bacterium]|nr:MFS transporter [Rhizobiaceae bacterium]
FSASVMAGSLTRISQGATPFLIPLMLQLGFGLSAAAAGQISIATALGSMAMKPLQVRILRTLGFRTSLMIFGVIGTLAYGLCSIFRPDWPLPLVFVILFFCGFFMSFQFTAYNTIAYDEIGRDRMSSATSFYTTFQQLMLSLGICIAALALHASMYVHAHETAEMGDFSIAFVVVTLIALLAMFWNARFSRTAGSEISGHRRKSPEDSLGGH